MATQADKTNNGVIFTVVIVGAFAMISVSMLLAALVRGERRELEAERPSSADLVGVAKMKAAQRKELAAPPAWKDKAQGLATVPVSLAMKLVLNAYTADPFAASPQIPEGFRLSPEGRLVQTALPTKAAAGGAVEAGATGSSTATSPGDAVRAPGGN